ncbi:hypothetical protein RFM98_03195 [Mesorhizobium sp. VK9D]|uniref:hypothetical protein n=1 Tax=Mesorhizobium australafricanum TaxID=3072311 RepID=UPI002A23C08F|nr:hypothetical protein [Mesorhizobium sp. VK9D]MDX8451754.1 hypothetical protein [Mesorhizobium sp. VK9D]
MEWIAFAKSDSAAFDAYGIDYARRRKKVVAADYHACRWKMGSFALVLDCVSPKVRSGLSERHMSKQELEASRLKQFQRGML